jgi:antitoxin component YwqK of YwqJK toxin-antitoxin module
MLYTRTLTKLSNLTSLSLLSFLLLGCGQKIDARQAHTEEGLIYKENSTTPFSGTLINVGANEIGKEFGSKFIPASSSCTVPVKNGLFDGMATCNNASRKTAEVSYSQGHQNGKFETWAPSSGVLTTSATLRMGIPDGLIERFNPDSGKLISQLEVESGKKSGHEKQWNFTGETLLTDVIWTDGHATGVYRSGSVEEHFKNGLLNGVRRECRFSFGAGQSEKGAAALSNSLQYGGTWFVPQMVENPSQMECTEANYKDGLIQNNTLLNSANTSSQSSSKDACVDAKIDEFHKTNGEDAVIINDVITEWEESCTK